MEIKINIEAEAIKESIANFKKKTYANKKNIAMALIAIYIIASIFYNIVNDVAMSVTDRYIFDGVCENISDHNLTMNGMTLYFFFKFSNTTKEMMEGNEIKIDCWYSEKRDAWYWTSIENLNYKE